MAERNFDEEFDYESQEGHSFTLGGHTFHTKPVLPVGAFMVGGKGLAAAVRFLRRAVVPEDRAALESVLDMADSSAAIINTAPELYATVAYFLAAEDGADEAAREDALGKLRGIIERLEKAQEEYEPTVMVSGHEVDVVAEWLQEVTIGRPLTSSGSSSDGAGAISNGSKATSAKRARASVS